jgi:hypothetical protein
MEFRVLNQIFLSFILNYPDLCTLMRCACNAILFTYKTHKPHGYFRTTIVQTTKIL